MSVFLLYFITAAISAETEYPTVANLKINSGKVWILKGNKKEEAKKKLELKEGDMLEIEDKSSVIISYFSTQKREEYKSRATVTIGKDESTTTKGTFIPPQELKPTNITTDRQPKNIPPPGVDNSQAGGQFTRGILPPKQYFEDKSIQRYAVIVGISDYLDPKIPDLKYADADAQAFYDFITSPLGGSFEKKNVRLLKNDQATLKNVKQAITNFLKQATDADFVVIFMACHGEPEPDRPNNLYLLMHDSELESLPATAYHMENINEDMRRYISAKRLIMFADACHSAGLTAGGIGVRGFSNTINIALTSLQSTREGWGIMSASRAGEISMESQQWGGGHGAFTHYLLEGMEGKADNYGNKNGIVTLAEAFDYVEEKVKRATQNAQHPDTAGNFDNNLPLGFPGKDLPKEETQYGTLRISASQENATVAVGTQEIGTTPATVKLVSGTYSVKVKKKNFSDREETVFINPHETTDVYFDFVQSQKREITPQKPLASSGTHIEYAESARSNNDPQKTKDNIDHLIKELEVMVQSQPKEKSEITKKTEGEKPETIEILPTVPISIKEFSTRMEVLPEKRDMERLRQRIIDSLLNQKGLSVVERDLEFQEDILREQRLGGSILADGLYRIALGKIQAADFLCFGGVSAGESTDQLVLRMEIVDTATTLVDALEYTFATTDNLMDVANTVALKIRDKIAKKRKL